MVGISQAGRIGILILMGLVGVLHCLAVTHGYIEFAAASDLILSRLFDSRFDS